MYEDIIREVKGGRNLEDIMTEIQAEMDKEKDKRKEIAAAKTKVKEAYYEYMDVVTGVKMPDGVKEIFSRVFDQLFEEVENTAIKIELKDGSGPHAKEKPCKKSPDEVIKAFLENL